MAIEEDAIEAVCTELSFIYNVKKTVSYFSDSIAIIQLFYKRHSHYLLLTINLVLLLQLVS